MDLVLESLKGLFRLFQRTRPRTEEEADYFMRCMLAENSAKLDRAYRRAVEELPAEEVVMLILDPRSGLERDMATAAIGTEMTDEVIRHSRRMLQRVPGVVIVSTRAEVIEAVAELAPNVARDLAADKAATLEAGHFHVVVMAFGRMWLCSQPAPSEPDTSQSDGDSLVTFEPGRLYLAGGDCRLRCICPDGHNVAFDNADSPSLLFWIKKQGRPCQDDPFRVEYPANAQLYHLGEFDYDRRQEGRWPPSWAGIGAKPSPYVAHDLALVEE